MKHLFFKIVFVLYIAVSLFVLSMISPLIPFIIIFSIFELLFLGRVPSIAKYFNIWGETLEKIVFAAGLQDFFDKLLK